MYKDTREAHIEGTLRGIAEHIARPDLPSERAKAVLSLAEELREDAGDHDPQALMTAALRIETILGEYPDEGMRSLWRSVAQSLRTRASTPQHAPHAPK